MAVFKIKKNRNYTNISNFHFRDKTLSWKAKGILSNMLSLPEDWDYSLAGLATLASDGMSATRTAIKELEEHGYLIRRPIRQNGKIADWEYIIFECPEESQIYGKPLLDNQVVENQQIENHTQLNTNKSNTKELNTKKNNIYDENFEMLWKKLKSTPYDRKSKVSKKRKKELYEMGTERTLKAIDVYLATQNPKYYYKRDNFLNEIIENYLDKDKSDFEVKAGKNENENRTDFSKFEFGTTL